ncbi:MAG: hypothetical protein JXR66_07785 [Bacteroidales bacterium]|nr:hypothetical protein [Bacteroidales bacterium]MBN2633438.1 hypothetical protein [Bacteroidales bacterium]
MLNVNIPGYKTINAEHLVLDFNGTIAVDGLLLEGVAEKLISLSSLLHIHILTADTFGTVENQMRNLPVMIKKLDPNDQDSQKSEYVKKIGPERVIAAGNGRNDLLMLSVSSLGIGIIQDEGACSQIFTSSDVICKTIIDALLLLINPGRLIATLRN